MASQLNSTAEAVSATGRFLERREREIVACLLLVGIVERIIWASGPGRMAPFVSEMQQVAATFANTGVLGDAYFSGQGPTAHVGPVMPLIGGFIYRLFGVGSPTSEVLLLALALMFFSAGLIAYYAAFRRLGLAIEWRMAALAVAALSPLYIKFEAQSFRIWEGALAVALLSLVLLLVLRLDARDRLSARDFAVPALLGGLAVLVNPPVALGAYACLGVLALKRAPVRHWPGVALVMTVGLAVFVAPWAVRNERALGRPILTRSNFPLEHAIGFHPGAVSPADPRGVYIARLRSIHPSSGEPVSAPRSEFARIGELAYMERLKVETASWEKDHPADVARIAARHFVEFWLPPEWVSRIYPGHPPLVLPRLIFTWVTAFAAVGALIWGLVRSPFGPRLYVACALLLPSLPYILVQPLQRYRYLVLTLTIFLSAELASLVLPYVRSGLGRLAPRRSRTSLSPN